MFANCAVKSESKNTLLSIMHNCTHHIPEIDSTPFLDIDF